MTVQNNGVTVVSYQESIQTSLDPTKGLISLVDGTIDVLTSFVTADSRIFLTTQSGPTGSPLGTAGFLIVSARTPGTSFTILSSESTDNSEVAWVIVQPAPLT